MSQQKRIGGKLHLKVGGVVYRARGDFSYNVGGPVRTEVDGADGPQGYTERETSGWIEGTITDDGSVKVADLRRITGATVTLDLANGKKVSATNAFAAGDFTVNAEEGSIPFRFVGDVEEI